MKPKFTYSLILFVSVMMQFVSLQAQTDALKYRRSSLNLVLIESDNFPNKETVVNSYKEHPFPDKYNKHAVGKETIDYKLTEKDLLAAGFLEDTLKEPMKILKAISSLKTVKYIEKEQTKAVIVPNGMDSTKIKIDKYIRETSLPKMMVAKWLNKKDDGIIKYQIKS